MDAQIERVGASGLPAHLSGTVSRALIQSIIFERGIGSTRPAYPLSEKIMTEPRNSEHHRKVHQEKAYYGVASTKGGAAAAVAGRTAYRQEFQRNYGPDLDESLDGTESGHEF